MKKNIFFLCSFVCSFAAPVELCVSFECENCYSIRVQKIETLEKKQWSLSDSVACECGMWLPPSFEIKNLPGNYLSGVGGGCVAFEKKRKMMKMPSMPQMNIQQGDIVYTAYVDTPKEKILPQYKQNLDFYWKVHFVCQDNNSNDTTLTYKIDALLVGECPDSLTTH